jgi:hypothetical protein
MEIQFLIRPFLESYILEFLVEFSAMRLTLLLSVIFVFGALDAHSAQLVLKIQCQYPVRSVALLRPIKLIYIHIYRALSSIVEISLAWDKLYLFVRSIN